MLMFIASEVMFFVAFFWAYFDPALFYDEVIQHTPCFGIYMIRNILATVKATGGLQAMEAYNLKKGGMIYEVIDGHADFFRSPVARDARSYMNIVFRLPSEELEEKFVAEGKKRRFLGLKGHRSVGGIRISTYNSCPLEACEAVSSFMKEFVKANG